MKILHISPMYYPALGGAEVHLKEVSEGLAARGHDVTVLTANVQNTWDLWPAQDGALPATEVINGVTVIRVRPDAGRLAAGFRVLSELPGGHRALRLLFTLDGVHLLARGPRAFGMLPHILRARADIVASMNWYWPPAVYAYLARRLKRFRLVGIPLFHTAEDWCNREIYKRMLVQCEAIIANTQYEGEFASQRGARRVEVGGVGIHPAAFDGRNGASVRLRYGLGDRPVVGFVGRATPNKGIGPVVESMRHVWAWNPEVRLVLAGPTPGKTSPLESLLATLTEAERERVVRIHDFAERDKASIYDAFDVFVLPSTGESFGLGYLEAWMCRKPVIGARIGPTSCIIDEGENGLLANPDDPADLARGIIDLLADRSKRERMGQRGHDKTLAHYTWARVTEKVERLYHDLLTT
ncbi:MAG TPA: glycosyltransferase family 4 protein [Gemmatimonadales bacterium]|nr:glycosyltransferase family 4 protein [Gemmatimonadales bacterium]